MTEIELAALIAGVATLLVSVLAQVELWQRKEYRLDRMLSHWRSPQGSLANYPIVSLALLLVGWGWFAFLSAHTTFADFAGLIALLAFAAYHGDIIYRRGLRRPEFTVKALGIIALTLAALVVYFYYAFALDIIIALQLATLIFLLPALITVAVLLINIPFAFRKQQIINRAKVLRRSLPNLTVVGITGSYGKTSTKHFLEQILRAAGKKVAATHDHHNTPIGVAQDMLAQLNPDLEIYIAELGAYRRGEIKQLAELTQPRIGIITAIGNQHLDLFGSLENILKTKWELIEALPQGGTAILNADDQQLMKMAPPAGISVTKYSLDQKDTLPPLPTISDILIGNVLAACAAAEALGVPAETVRAALPAVRTFSRTMELKSGKNGAQVIDDSYSANETGVIKAIEYLKSFPQTDKRIVLLPLIELGSEASAVHARIGEAIRASGVKLFVAGKVYEKELGPGVYENDPKQLATLVSHGLSENSVVLLENRIPDVIRRAVL
jgi:UDP-N-acetylmuramoyl-tripeptide--D-alanyl-D-alanine ligase